MPAPFVNRILLTSIRAQSVFNEKTFGLFGENKFIFYSPLSMFLPYVALNPTRQKQKRTYNNNNSNINPQRFDGDGPASDRLSIL